MSYLFSSWVTKMETWSYTEGNSSLWGLRYLIALITPVWSKLWLDCECFVVIKQGINIQSQVKSYCALGTSRGRSFGTMQPMKCQYFGCRYLTMSNLSPNLKTMPESPFVIILWDCFGGTIKKCFNSVQIVSIIIILFFEGLLFYLLSLAWIYVPDFQWRYAKFFFFLLEKKIWESSDSWRTASMKTTCSFVQ